MHPDRLRELLLSVRAGSTDVDAAMQLLRRLPFDDLGFAHVDHHRALRQGVPEVILGRVEDRGADRGRGALADRRRASRVRHAPRAEKAEAVVRVPELAYHDAARTASYHSAAHQARTSEPALVVTAGTSDMPVADEALETMRMFGVPRAAIFDVGVAGLHRTACTSCEPLQARPR